MSGLMIVETMEIGLGYKLANQCCLNLRNTLLEALPLSGQRFLFIVEGQDLELARARILTVQGVIRVEILANPHPQLLKTVFHLSAPALKESLGVFSFSCFPTMAKIVNEALGHGLEIMDIRYGRLIQEANFFLASGSFDQLSSFERKFQDDILKSEVESLLAASFRDLF